MSFVDFEQQKTVKLWANIFMVVFFFYYLHGVSGPAYAHHDYSPRPTGHPASPGAGKAPRG